MTHPTVARIVRRAWKEYSDLRRRVRRDGSADSALACFPADRNDIAAWNDATARHHPEYRQAHPVPAGDVAIICASNRPERLGDVIANIGRQRIGLLDVVYVSHHDDHPDHDALRASFDSLATAGHRVSTLTCAAASSLGACLNAGLDATDARFVAKFDDDDHYGPDYLTDMLRSHGYAGAGIVGKHTWYAHLEEIDETILRFPGHEFTYTSTIAGATLVIDRDRVGDLRFRDVSVGEDRAFIADCNRRGISSFAADRFNFVVSRSADNSWRMPRDEFIRKSIVLGPGLPLDEIDR